MKTVRSCIWLSSLLVLAHVVYAADAFTKWWPQFQATVAKADAKTISQGMTFPMPWENGKIREIKSQDDFIQNFAKFVTPEIKKMIATRKPERMPTGDYIITWKARGNEYSIYFKAGANDTFTLNGLSEGPP